MKSLLRGVGVSTMCVPSPHDMIKLFVMESDRELNVERSNCVPATLSSLQNDSVMTNTNDQIIMNSMSDQGTLARCQPSSRIEMMPL